MRPRTIPRGLLIALLLSTFSLIALLACTGESGPPGSSGKPGAPGELGSDGSPGETGPQGPDGPQVLAGPQGPAGADGARGSQGPAGVQGVAGVGARGNPGAPGALGAVGPPGPAGLAAVSPEAGLMVSKSTVTLNEPLTVAGSGFRPSEAVTLVLVTVGEKRIVGGGSGAQVTASAAGAFVVELDRIGGSVAPGVQTLKAEGSDGSVASLPIMIVATAMLPPTMPGSSLVANAVEVGGTTTIWGAGFHPGEPVTLTVLAVGGGIDKILIAVPANESGAFMVDANVELAAGVYTLMGTGSMGSEATAALMVSEPK